MSYRTNDKLHVVLALTIGITGIIVGGLAFGSWWYAGRLGGGDFWGMFALALILTVVAVALVGVAAWAIVDVVRVRRAQ